MHKKTTGTTALLVLVTVLFAILVFAVLLLVSQPSFQLTQETVLLNVGDSFSPTDYLTEMKSIATSDLTISGDVNTKVPGSYTVSYTYGRITKTLLVNVRDNTPPTILLLSKNFTITEGEEPDVNAIAKGEDATKVTLSLDYKGQDIHKPGRYTITVRCEDTSGNRSEEEITLTVKSLDTTSPVINGTEDTAIMVGDFFDPKVVSVTDNLDPAPVLTVDEGGFDNSTPGVYTITYTATDAHGNQAVASRKVTVTTEYLPVLYTPKGGTFSWDARGIADQPYLVCVNRAMCTITVYGKDDYGNYTVPVKAIACSVAREGYETPTGRFSTTDRYTWCYMVDGSWGRYAIRIHRGIMFHSVCYFTTNINDLEYEEYNKLGSPASLGCIRLCVADEKWLYDNCPQGFSVEIYDDTAVSGPLGKPDPIRIDVNDTDRRGWDPTDWDDKNPWNQ